MLLLPALILALLANPARADEPTIAVGPVVVLPTLAAVETEGLVLTTCAAAPIQPANDVQSGTLIFEVRMRRGRVALVSVVTEEPGLTAYRPCLERVLTEYAWPVRTAKLRVPVAIDVR